MPLLSRPRWKGLRFKIVAWTFFPTAITLVAVGLVSFYAFQRTTRYLLIERNRELVRLTAAQLSVELQEFPDLLRDVAASLVLYSPNQAVEQARLKAVSSSLVVFDGGVVVTDEHGVVIAAEPERPNIIGQDWSNRSYFREVVRNRQAVFSDIVPDGPEGARTIVVATPVIDAQDEFQGMAAGMFRLGGSTINPFYGKIVKMRIGKNDYAYLNAYLVDHNGQVIYHSDTNQIGKDFSKQTAVRYFSGGKVVDAFAGMLPGQTGVLGNAGALRERDIGGRDVVAYYASVPGTEWGLVSEASWGGLLSVYRSYLFVQSLLFFLGVAIPALVVGYGIRQITEPIYRLMGAAKEVAAGNFGHRVAVDSQDELEDLSQQFNDMSEQLSQNYTALQEREERLALVMQGVNDGIWDWDIASGLVYYSPRWKSMLGYSDEEVGNTFEAWLGLVHPEDRDRSLRTIDEHLANKNGLFNLEHRMRHKDGSYRWIQARAITLRDSSGHPLRMVGSHSDITARKEAEAALQKTLGTLEERVEERTRYLRTLNNISARVNRSLNLNTTLSDALDETLGILKMEYGIAYRLEGGQEDQWITPEEENGSGPEQLFLNPLVYRNISEQFIRSTGRISLKETGIAALVNSESPLVWSVEAVHINPELKRLLKQEGVEQVVSVPLRVKGRLTGALQLGSRAERSFSPEELAMLSAIGQQVGVAVENARLHQAVQQSATLEERARLARELHDSVTQSLYSVTLLAEASARLLEAGDSRQAADHLRELRDTAQESLREMRLLIYELRPVALEQSSLADALHLRLEAVEARSGMKTELVVEGTEKLSQKTKAELYQIAQETLNNILKHSSAGKVHIELHYLGSSACLEIRDDGVGFDPNQAANSGGMGLAGIAERAQKIGATFDLQSAPGKGTSVRIEIGAQESADQPTAS